MKNKLFIDMVEQDLHRTEMALSSHNGVLDLLSELLGKYSKVSSNFPKIDMNSLLYRMHPEMPSQHLRMIQGFLSAYQLNDCEDYKFDETRDGGINVITNISNSNENKNSISVHTFAEVKNEIESMTSLTESEIEEILAKVSELEEIVNSNDRKSKKWETAKSIIKWMAEKGVDIGLTLLPLLLQIK